MSRRMSSQPERLSKWHELPQQHKPKEFRGSIDARANMGNHRNYNLPKEYYTMGGRNQNKPPTQPKQQPQKPKKQATPPVVRQAPPPAAATPPTPPPAQHDPTPEFQHDPRPILMTPIHDPYPTSSTPIMPLYKPMPEPLFDDSYVNEFQIVPGYNAVGSILRSLHLGRP